ncbi:MAG TPA: hypothetical protein VM011_02565 [Gammaproteobacteria bacterium]|nr:hypothetical protein [Gammaproteobacteria bacterium]
MKTRLSIVSAVAALLSCSVHADTTLVYDLVDAAGQTTQQTYSIRGRFLRVDKSNEAPENFLLLDGGFLYMNVVNGEKQTFTTFGDSPHHQGGTRLPAAAPKAESAAAPAPAAAGQAAEKSPPKNILSPTTEKNTVAGFSCRVVREMRDDKLLAEHCLVDAYALGMTPRELISMARLIEFSRQRTDPDWIAIQSDEQFITIRSRPAVGEPTFILKSVSHEIVPREYFRVPAEYEKLQPADDYTGLITGKKQAGD